VVDSLDRWLALEGLDNVRDVGGLPLRDGGQTRPGVLLRSASLHYLTPGDVEHLVDVLGLKLVLDLRTGREVDRDGPTAVARAGVETVWLSFLAEDGEPLPEADDDLDPMVHNYLGYLSQRGENVVQAVRRLAAPDAGPALVHCAAGKDRTGVVVALALAVAEVPHEEIVADYAMTAEVIDALVAKLAASPTYAEDMEQRDTASHTPRAETMDRVLTLLDERFGGPVGWLEAHGFGAHERAALKARLRN
jgi:protein-tyrosine phosphatase